ncbi:MAG: hypothetical protein AB3N64_14185 [Puniceicoccaceae bacterium]
MAEFLPSAGDKDEKNRVEGGAAKAPPNCASHASRVDASLTLS